MHEKNIAPQAPTDETIYSVGLNNSTGDAILPPTFKYSFKVPGQEFRGTESQLFGSADNLEPTKLGNGEKYFCHPFINVQQLVVEASKSVVVEVAGPTAQGYKILDGLALHTKPLITNIASAEKYTEPGKVDQLTEKDKSSIDFLADVKHLPFADKSIGVLLGSCLQKVDIPIMRAHKLNFKQLDTLLTVAAKKMSDGESVEHHRNVSPRVGFWLEAGRTVKDGGVVIYKGAAEQDIIMAKHMGFSMIAHGPLSFIRYFGEKTSFDDVPQEIVFIKDASYGNFPLEPTAGQVAQSALRAMLKEKFPSGVPD